MIHRPSQVALAILLFASGLYPLRAQGAAQPADLCAQVLTHTGRDEFEQLDEADLRSYYYRNLCKSDGTGVSLSGNNSTLGLLTQASQAFGISYQSTSQYCEENSSASSARTSSYRRVSKVVDKALDNWLACIKITKQNISIEPDFRYDRVTFGIFRSGPTVGNITKIDTDKDQMQCIGYTSTDVGGVPEVVTTDLSSAPVKLSILEKLTVVCKRASRKSTDVAGGVIYSGGVITVVTSDGPVNFELPDEPRGPETWGRDIQASISALQTQVDALRAKLANRARFGHADDTTSNQVLANLAGMPNSQYVGLTGGVTGNLLCPERRVAVGLAFDGKGGVSALCTPLGWMDEGNVFTNEAATP